MSYVVTGGFSLPLPDDLRQMGSRLAEITEAWQVFCQVVGTEADSELRLVQPRQASNGGRRAAGEPALAA